MNLTAEELGLRNDLDRRVKEFRIDAEHSERIRALSEMRDMAISLHQSLAKRGHVPKHHAYMIENRGVAPDDPEFYFHIHPIQDLIKFTDDPHANDDPVDQTIGDEFDFRVFTRRWGHDEIYRLTRTATGWLVKVSMYTGPCDKACAPVLYDALRHDTVVYPHDVGEWFEWLWQQAKDKGLDHAALQDGLNDIAEWIRVTETSAPVSGVWEGLAGRGQSDFSDGG